MYKIARFWLSTFVFYSPLRLNSITVFNMSTCFGIFYPARLVRMCWIASKTSTWNKQFKRQKRKMIKPIWIRKAHFSVEMFFVCSRLPCTFLSNVTVFFGLVCTENTRKRLKVSKELACRFELFQFPPVVNWNFSFTHTHMELHHAVTTHQWTRKPVYYNYNISFLQLIFLLITGHWKLIN